VRILAAMTCSSTQYRCIAWCLGIVLLAAAIFTIWSRSGEISSAILSIERPSLWSILSLVGITIISTGLVSESFRQLLNRKGIAETGACPIGRSEMFWLILVTGMLNWLPLRAGLIGRTVYHHKVNRIRASQSIRVLLEFVVILVCVAGLALLLAVLGNRCGVHPSLVLLFPVLIAVPLAFPKRSGCWTIAILFRYGDVVLLALKYWIIFDLMNHQITLETAILLAGAGSIASLLPLPTGGLGGREWIIGLVAAWVTVFPAAIALGLLADMVNRLVELVVVVPLGLFGLRIVKKRLTESLSS